ncbi:hypothetical protein MRX96_000981 [Rhipicephalus microplus]
MIRHTLHDTELLWQSQSESSPVHQLRRPKAAIAASLTLLLLVFVSIAAELPRRHGGWSESESRHPEIARLSTANFGIDDISGPATAAFTWLPRGLGQICSVAVGNSGVRQAGLQQFSPEAT